MTSGGKHKLTLPWGGKSKIENDLMRVENARGAEFVKMHSPRLNERDMDECPAGQLSTTRFTPKF